MESLTSGTLAGTGSFRCEECGYVVTLAASDQLPDCPGMRRLALRAGIAVRHRALRAQGRRARPPEERDALTVAARDLLRDSGEFLAWRDGDTVRVVGLEREWTRIGRSLAADVRFDDPTVSRRHALIVRQPDGVRVLDDRSLNGVFVNGERVEWRALQDGDEITVGRYRLQFLVAAPHGVDAAGPVASRRPARHGAARRGVPGLRA